MHLIELYKSVQGESSFAGVPCIFVRLAGCNLRCAWCDSEYTFTGGKPYTADEIVAQLEARAPCTLVEFTGGEPMLQAKELLPLMDRLLAQNYTLMIETSGERPLADVPKAVHKIVDVKCPGAGFIGISLDMFVSRIARSRFICVSRARKSYNIACRSSRSPILCLILSPGMLVMVTIFSRPFADSGSGIRPTCTQPRISICCRVKPFGSSGTGEFMNVATTFE